MIRIIALTLLPACVVTAENTVVQTDFVDRFPDKQLM